jgi:hypothetical protein
MFEQANTATAGMPKLRRIWRVNLMIVGIILFIESSVHAYALRRALVTSEFASVLVPTGVCPPGVQQVTCTTDPCTFWPALCEEGQSFTITRCGACRCTCTSLGEAAPIRSLSVDVCCHVCRHRRVYFE